MDTKTVDAESVRPKADQSAHWQTHVGAFEKCLKSTNGEQFSLFTFKIFTQKYMFLSFKFDKNT